MEFQVIDWFCRDEKSNRLVDDNTIGDNYVIHMFGCDKEGNSVHVKVNNFKPYFFVKVPKFFKKQHVETFKEFLQEQIYYKHKNNIISCNLQKRMDFNGYHTEADKFVVIHFHNLGAFYSAKRLFKEGTLIKTIPEITSMPLRFHSYEANLDPMLRFIHIAKIEPAGWIHIDKFKKSTIANTTIDIETDWMHVQPYEGDHGVAPLKQASFDIECTSGDGISFPEPSRIEDKIIQIGTTVYTYGKDNSKPLKHIICLKNTSNIDGAIVESYETEEEVLLAWTKFIKKLDPDILTGYNIYGFDFRYMYERAKLLRIEDKFCLLGRLKGEKSELVEKKLSSSALGFNEMHILPMIGRLQIDLFKVIQRDFNFESYKLDAVSAEFIKGKISDVKYTKSYTHLFGQTFGLAVGNYISLLVDGYKHVENKKKKFQILEIKGDRIRIEKLQEKPSSNSKIQWCLAKDDVSPKEIFRLQKGTPDDRAMVGKYCVAKGTNITLNNFQFKIEDMYDNNEIKVLSWNKQLNGISLSSQTKHFNNGLKECIEITLEDNTKIQCTNDHEILMNNNWVKANELTIKDNLYKSIIYPVSNINEYIEKYYDWEFCLNIQNIKFKKNPNINLRLNFKTKEDVKFSLTWVRLLGLVLSDGTITNDNASVYLGTLYEVNSVIDDIFLLTKKHVKYYKSKNQNTYSICLPRELSIQYLYIKGISSGNRMKQDLIFPEFLMNDNCPKPIIREFLGGLFGGDGNTTCLNKQGNKFTNIGFSQSAYIDYIETLKIKMNQVAKWLKLFNISSNIHNPSKNNNGDNMYSITLNIPMYEIPIFEKEIGFRYCNHKSFRLSVVASYFRKKQMIINQNNYVVETAYKYSRENNVNLKIASEYAYSCLQEKDKIVYNINSLPKFKTIGSRIRKNNIHLKNLPMQHKEFESPIEYLKRIGVYHLFTNDMPKCYSVKKDENITPMYQLKIINIKNIGLREVYDLEIKNTHNYLANGIIVHNCIMDNILCNVLMDKLDIIVNHIAMSNVCYVPMSFLFLRGQGIKAYSLVARQCRLDNYLIPDLRKTMSTEYQGATVLEAQVGGHFYPVACNDFASLYPSSMISHNLSPDTLITDAKTLQEVPHETIDLGNNEVYHFVKPEETSEEDKHNPEVQKNRKGRGILPRILIHLLQSRKEAKKRMAKETDPFKKSLLDGLQLSYKLTCNSIYGQCGSGVSAIACKPVAGATTAIGRQLLEFAGKKALETFPGSELVYGDTDSCMVKYPVPETCETKSEKLQHAIQCARTVEQIVSDELPWPHNFEYEKTYYPYILYSKKRYSGVMYENDTENYSKIDNKGIVLKRRDNAKIVKYIFGGCLNIILFEQNVEKALEFMRDSIDKMFRGEFDIGMFIISKALKVTKTVPAHKMLADRMTQRDPGNAPQLNDRIPYVYVVIDKERTKEMLNEYNIDITEKTKKRKKLLQGDLIETPDYVQEHNLPIDYLFYLTNQLTNPLTQLFGIFEDVDGDVDVKEKAFKKRVIKPLEQKYKNKQNGIMTIDMFFKKKNQV